MTTVRETADRAIDVEASVRDVLDDRIAAMRSGDADRLVGLYAPDVVRFGLAPPLQTAGAGARNAADVQAWLEGFAATPEYDVTQLVVQVTGDVAFSHSLNRMSATPRGASEPFELWYRETLGLRKLGGTWRINHEHISTPFYMDGSFRAAVDLRP